MLVTFLSVPFSYRFVLVFTLFNNRRIGNGMLIFYWPLLYIHMAITYWTTKFKSTNILAIGILGSTAKFNSRQYFQLYCMLRMHVHHKVGNIHYFPTMQMYLWGLELVFWSTFPLFEISSLSGTVNCCLSGFVCILSSSVVWEWIRDWNMFPFLYLLIAKLFMIFHYKNWI